MRLHLEYYIQLWEPQHKKHMDLLKDASDSSTGMSSAFGRSPGCAGSGISHIVIEMFSNIDNHSKPAVHPGKPVEEEAVMVICLRSVSTALVDKFRISLSRQNRNSSQNFFYLQKEFRQERHILSNTYEEIALITTRIQWKLMEELDISIF
ncbi:hypothetical protein BTVI_138685 [Pitangus sulphuratus]|nr:hypothetical protein BTVI_138685 [Pitangus sulphuratus]